MELFIEEEVCQILTIVCLLIDVVRIIVIVELEVVNWRLDLPLD